MVSGCFLHELFNILEIIVDLLPTQARVIGNELETPQQNTLHKSSLMAGSRVYFGLAFLIQNRYINFFNKA
jgi:hypothetical protein